MSILDLGAKECTGCALTKPLTEFRPHPRARDGRQSRCRECERNYAAAYYEGARRGDFVVRGQRASTGPFVCTDPIARLKRDNKTCRNCGYPVVARMDPELQGRMAVKAPHLADQTVIAYDLVRG